MVWSRFGQKTPENFLKLRKVHRIFQFEGNCSTKKMERIFWKGNKYSKRELVINATCLLPDKKRNVDRKKLHFPASLGTETWNVPLVQLNDTYYLITFDWNLLGYSLDNFFLKVGEMSSICTFCILKYFSDEKKERSFWFHQIYFQWSRVNGKFSLRKRLLVITQWKNKT